MAFLHKDKSAEARAPMREMFDTKSHAWREVGLAGQVSRQAARRAGRQLLFIVPLLAGVLVAYKYRQRLLGLDVPVRLATVVALVILGWAFARDVGRVLGPALFRRLDPGTAGTVGFLIRLGTIGVALLAALNIAGLPPRTLALGGAFTAVIVGLAAQQTLGNLIAGTVLLSARPFRVGDRVRLQGGGIGGRLEGVVSSLGLLYLTLASGEDSILVPNSVVLGLDVRGVLPIAAWLPNLDELRPIINALADSRLRAYIVMGEDDPSFGPAMELAGLLQKHKATVKLDARPGVGHEYPADMETTLSRALKFLAGPD